MPNGGRAASCSTGSDHGSTRAIHPRSCGPTQGGAAAQHCWQWRGRRQVASSRPHGSGAEARCHRVLHQAGRHGAGRPTHERAQVDAAAKPGADAAGPGLVQPIHGRGPNRCICAVASRDAVTRCLLPARRGATVVQLVDVAPHRNHICTSTATTVVFTQLQQLPRSCTVLSFRCATA